MLGTKRAGLNAKPRGACTVSADPRSNATVEKRTNTSVRLPAPERNFALVHFATSGVTSK